MGARYYDNGQTNEGKTFVYNGNSSAGLRSTVQQYQYGSSTIIKPDGKVASDGQIRFSNYAKSPFGRAKGKLEYEYQPTGTPFFFC